MAQGVVYAYLRTEITRGEGAGKLVCVVERETSTSSALKSTVAHALETTEKTFFWLSITIFDEPVVPEVNRISAILSLSLSGVKNLVLFLPDATILS